MAMTLQQVRHHAIAKCSSSFGVLAFCCCFAIATWTAGLHTIVRLAERVGEILKICWSKPTHFWVGFVGFVHLQGTPYDNSGKISLMCLKMARSRGPKSSKFVGELLVFSRVGQIPTRSASLTIVLHHAGGARALFLFLVVFLAFDFHPVHSACSVHASTLHVVRRLVLVPHLYRQQSSKQILYIYIYHNVGRNSRRSAARWSLWTCRRRR